MANDRMHITVYGANTSGQQLVVSTLKSYLRRAEIDFDLVERSDVSEFLAKSLNSVPAIEVDESIFCLKQNGSFNQSLRSAMTFILAKRNYGKLPKI